MGEQEIADAAFRHCTLPHCIKRWNREDNLGKGRTASEGISRFQRSIKAVIKGVEVPILLLSDTPAFGTRTTPFLNI